MSFKHRFTLPKEHQRHADAAWFQEQKQRNVHKNDATLRRWLSEQVDALQTFHDGHTTTDETAHAITISISSSPVLDLGGYSDDILALDNLWIVLIAALLEWPTTRTPDLFALLDAIAKIPDKIHNGQTADDDGRPLTWAQFPYFALMWPYNLRPGSMARSCPDQASLASARRLYCRIKEIEAQLLAKRVMTIGLSVIQDMIRSLEKDIDDSDRQVAPGEAAAYVQVRLDFHIPAAASMFKYCGRDFYNLVVRDELKHMTPGQMPDEARKFETGAERWSFWKRRLTELAAGDELDEVKVAAGSALQYMAMAE